MGLASRRELLRLDAADGVVHVRKPVLGRRGMAREHKDAEPMRLATRRAQAQVVEPLAFVRGDHRAEGPMQQRVGLLEAGQALDLSEHLRADGFDVVMKPADAVALTGEHRVRFDDRGRLLALAACGFVQTSLHLQFRHLVLIRPPEFDKGRDLHRLGAFSGH